ncbi:hypothetical protein [Haloterrigena salifodinae]|uniref:hypothetical protein n=1 Tax=Haloterrigena salifodinae TaxID=2675099 RepID=UPI000F85F88F|nr:hypothetical protein [Haloterrigena salifodinae]
MNVNEAVDVGTIALSGALLRDAKFFSRSLESPPLVEIAAEATVSDVNLDVTRAGVRDVNVETQIGDFDAAYMPWQWLGPKYPTLIFHHGSGERPFDFGRFSSNSFRRLFVSGDRNVPANLVVVRAPFHDRSSAAYARAMGDLKNFVGMLAASATLVEGTVSTAAAGAPPRDGDPLPPTGARRRGPVPS